MTLPAIATAETPVAPSLPAGSPRTISAKVARPTPRRSVVTAGDDPDDTDEDLGEDEDLGTQTAPEEESTFEDFDDDFDDDFEEEENDPDWDPPEENEPPPPPAKGPTKRK